MYAPMPDEWSRMSKHLSATAKALFVDALTWCQSDAELTDGSLAKVDLPRATYLPAADLGDAVGELILHGFWEDRGAAWFIWANGTIADLQITRDMRLEFKGKNRERKQRQRQRERRSDSLPLTASSSTTTPSQAKPRRHVVTSRGDVTRDTPPVVLGEDVTRDVTRDTPEVDLGACCDEPDITSWGQAVVCRTCGTRLAG